MTLSSTRRRPVTIFVFAKGVALVSVANSDVKDAVNTNGCELFRIKSSRYSEATLGMQIAGQCFNVGSPIALRWRRSRWRLEFLAYSYRFCSPLRR